MDYTKINLRHQSFLDFFLQCCSICYFFLWCGGVDSPRAQSLNLSLGALVLPDVNF